MVDFSYAETANQQESSHGSEPNFETTYSSVFSDSPKLL